MLMETIDDLNMSKQTAGSSIDLVHKARTVAPKLQVFSSVKSELFLVK